MASLPLKELSGTFYRAVFQSREAQLLEGVLSEEGRFHHSGQAALYLSSRRDWTALAIERYLQPHDPPRVICELHLEKAQVLDLRNQDHCGAWGIDPSLSAVPWLPERAKGLRASTWSLSDAVRNGGADGMIYQARSAPERWHLVLFSWNKEKGARLSDSSNRHPFIRP